MQVELAIWDTAGQERFHALGPIYYRDAQAALLVYDITDADSFLRVQTWVKELKQMVSRQSHFPPKSVHCLHKRAVQAMTHFTLRCQAQLPDLHVMHSTASSYGPPLVQCLASAKALCAASSRCVADELALAVYVADLVLRLRKLLQNGRHSAQVVPVSCACNHCFLQVGPSIVIAIAANKQDLHKQQVVTQSQSEKYATTINALHFGTSAKTGEGLQEIFQAIADNVGARLPVPGIHLEGPRGACPTNC